MKNKTNLDKTTIGALNKLVYNNQKILLLILSVFIILLGGLTFAFDQSIEGLVFFLIGLFFLSMSLFWEKLLLKLQLRQKIFKAELYNIFEFENETIIINTYKDNEHFGLTKLKYNDITKVIENNEYIFIFISKVQAFVVSKNEMIEGSIENVSSLIKSKVSKYQYK